jgi:hypothetical protein
LNLKKPQYPFYELPAVALLANDSSINIVQTIEESRGNGFRSLLSFGLTKEIAAVLIDIMKISTIIEAHMQHTLINPNIVGLSSKRNEVHYRLLSLPAAPILRKEPGSTLTLYECCRLAALAYTTATLIALPLSTGVPQRLISLIQLEIEYIQFEDLYSCQARFYIWVLFLTGIWAEGMPERAWFIKQLKCLLELENISRWKDLKSVLLSFLWMSPVCDEGGMNLWDDIGSNFTNPG